MISEPTLKASVFLFTFLALNVTTNITWILFFSSIHLKFVFFSYAPEDTLNQKTGWVGKRGGYSGPIDLSTISVCTRGDRILDSLNETILRSVIYILKASCDKLHGK